MLNFQPTQADLGSRHDFAGYWRGDDVEVPQGTLAGPTEHVWRESISCEVKLQVELLSLFPSFTYQRSSRYSASSLS